MSDWRPRLIASDMDGTLLRWDETVSEATLAELDRWRADGVPFVLATGLAVALEHHGVDPADVLVFGDMPNDLPMIEWVQAAGGRAVAVANAHPSVRAATPEVTSGHEVDGVARYLEAVVLNGAIDGGRAGV